MCHTDPRTLVLAIILAGFTYTLPGWIASEVVFDYTLDFGQDVGYCPSNGTQGLEFYAYSHINFASHSFSQGLVIMAAVNVDLGGMQPFDCKGDATALAPRWKKWKSAFNYFVVGKGVTNIAQKQALLLHCAGMDVQELYATLPDLVIPPPAPGLNGNPPEAPPLLNDYEKTLKKLDDYFTTKVNVPYERHVFRQLKQEEETVDQFVTRLRRQAENCSWENQEEQIRDQVIDKCKSMGLRRKLLEKGTDLTLLKVLDIARSMEAVDIQVKNMGGQGNSTGGNGHEVNRVREFGARKKDSYGGKHSNTGDSHGAKHGNTGDKKRKSCFRCGSKNHYSVDSTCPAREVTCHKCSKVGHYAKVCRSGKGSKDSKDNDKRPENTKSKGQVNRVDHDTGRNDYAFSVHGNGTHSGMIEITVGGVPLKVLVDSGASTNIIDTGTWERLKLLKIKCTSKVCERELFAYGSKQPLELLGSFQCETKVVETGKCIHAEFVVIKGQGQPLLGRDTAMRLGVLKVGVGVNLVCDDIKKLFPECFEGVGKLKGYQVKLHVDDMVQPVVQPLRRPPFSLRSKIEAKLDELESLGIIEAVDGPSLWVSPLVVVPKSDGDVRLCVDMRQANEAVQRERYPIPTIEEVLQELNKSKVFTKLDLKWGYHQLELEEGSRGITTFITHKGLYRYRRLMFGITSAPEKYQQVIQQVLQGIDGVKNISDDIVVYGETQGEHDRRVRQVMERLKEKGLTLNHKKCEFSMPKLTFMGHVLSGNGVSIAEDKVKAVKEARAPTTPTEVRSFLGLVNYSGRFIPDLATTTEPLRRLTKKDESFLWEKEQEEAFRKLKSQLSNAETLGYFDRQAETYVISDASPVGLGAVLVQKKEGENRVIAYASRSLTDVEKRYSQTEKEALGLVWSCEHFYMYLLGTKFVLVTDHKPLEVLYSPKSKPSARVERWVLRLQSYDYKVQYRPGKSNIADPLSRLSCKSTGVNSRNVAEEYVMFVAQEAVPRAMTARQVEESSNSDQELSTVRECIKSGNWEDSKLSRYYPVRDELCTVGKLVLRGTRLVIPQELRVKVMSLAHEGHVGMSATKLRLRTKVWWPGMDRDVVKYIESCHGCQLVAKANPPEPIVPTELPPGRWQDLAMDFLGPMPTGEYLFVVIDYYTRFYEVKITTSVTAKQTVRMLRKIIAAHGLPFSITSDNGPQFVSKELADFLEEQGICHRRVTPRWAQANGEVERQNRSMLKTMKIAQSQGKNWRDELITYLISYRTTPHSTTGVAPAELLYSRKVRTKLPELQQFEINDGEIRDRDLYKKVKSSSQMDLKRRAEKCDLELGDQVLVKTDKQNKLSANFGSVPYEVVQRKGNMVVVESPERVRYRRNITEVKRFIPRMEGMDNMVGGDDGAASTAAESGMSQDDKQSDEVETPPPPDSEVRGNCTPRPQRERRAPAHFDDYVRY